MRIVKVALLFTAAVAGLAGAWAIAVQYRIRLANDWQRYAALQEAPAPGPKDSILVVAPHCDDEVLGCGGILATAAEVGAKASVAVLTNGDGYRIAAGKAYRTLNVTPEECLRFAYDRQKESLAAVKILGLDASDVTFLGYPDRGLSRLWDTNWTPDNAYVSKATRWDRSPYSNSLTPGAVYCGESLVEDLCLVLERDKPSDIYVPHPSDNHPDHFAAYCFVLAAVEQVVAESRGARPRIHTYLVHRGDWPVPRGDHISWKLAPPSGLAKTGTVWRSLRLSRDAALRKRHAILSFKSQLAIEPGFMLSFARSNEIQGSVPVPRLARVLDGRMSADGDLRDWSGIPPVAIDPVNDHLAVSLSKAGDIRSIYLCADRERLFVRLDCAGKLSRRVAYWLDFKGIGAVGISDQCRVEVRYPDHCSYPSAALGCHRNAVELSLPLSDFAFSDDVFVRVTSRISRMNVDNTGWRAVRFSPSRESKGSAPAGCRPPAESAKFTPTSSRWRQRPS